jgi:hypothetical protein
MGDPGAQATRTQRAPQVTVIAALKLHHLQGPDLNPGIARAKKYQRVCSRLRLNNHADELPLHYGNILILDSNKLNLRERL